MTDHGDENGDGRISLFERAAYAAKGTTSSFPVLAATQGFVAGGPPLYGAKVKAVKTDDDLTAAIASVKGHHGRYAVVMFSATWCGFCKKFRPDFNRQAPHGECTPSS